MNTAIILLTVLLTAITAEPAGSAPATEPVTVQLSGIDHPLVGHLRQINDSRFLLQGEKQYYEFSGDQILTVDGRDEVPDSVRGTGRLIASSFYEKILPGGDVEVWSRNDVVNDTPRMLTSTSWGVADWELEQTQEKEIYDAYGNRLNLQVVPGVDGKHQAVVEFLVPVAPTETMGLVVKTLKRGASAIDGDTWRYTFNVDFSEDRTFLRKIELPNGATIRATYAGCRSLVHGGKVFLLSQRYYPANTVDPLTIEYTLP